LYRSRPSGYCLQAGPALCAYLYSQAIFRHVSLADVHHQQGRQYHRPKHIAVWRFSSCYAHTGIFRVPCQHRAFLYHTSHLCVVCGESSLMAEVAVSDPCRKISCLYQCLNIIGSFGGRQFCVDQVFFIWKTSTSLLSNARELSQTCQYIRYDLGNDLRTIICTIRSVYRSQYFNTV